MRSTTVALAICGEHTMLEKDRAAPIPIAHHRVRCRWWTIANVTAALLAQERPGQQNVPGRAPDVGSTVHPGSWKLLRRVSCGPFTMVRPGACSVPKNVSMPRFAPQVARRDSSDHEVEGAESRRYSAGLCLWMRSELLRRFPMHCSVSLPDGASSRVRNCCDP